MNDLDNFKVLDVDLKIACSTVIISRHVICRLDTMFIATNSKTPMINGVCLLE